MDKAVEMGAQLVEGEVTQLLFSDEKGNEHDVVGVILKSGTDLLADHVVVACGPWSRSLSNWGIPEAPKITGTKAHSIILNPSESSIDATAVFINYHSKGKMLHPEIYPRPGNKIIKDDEE